MRTENEMLELIIGTARDDERIRAVIMNGSRANPNAPQDIFQDFDIVYIVTEIAPFKRNHQWIKRFGEMMILQTPDDMGDSPSGDGVSYAYLMQFSDGNRIDLTIFPLDKLKEMNRDSLSALLLDKDGIIETFPPANESDYLPKPPTEKEFFECCNEFWWVSTYVAKGLWREELTYAIFMFDHYVHEELMKMLTWEIGVRTQFQSNPGYLGKWFKNFLEQEFWNLLLRTYAGTNYDEIWEAHIATCELFRKAARRVGEHFDYEYPQDDDDRVTAHLRHVRMLPKDAKEMYG